MKSLVTTSIGYDNRYHMIGWDSGKELWQIPCPGGIEALAITLTPTNVIFAVLEEYRGGPWRGSDYAMRTGGKEIIRAFYAARVEDGRLIARWQAHYPSRFYDSNFERFVRVENKLYFLASDEFCEINESDITEHKSGWQPVAEEK